MDLPLSVLNDIEKAVEIGNKKRLNSLLNGRFPTNRQASLDSSLEASTERADVLLQSFQRSVLLSIQDKNVLPEEWRLRALLMISPLYETPWAATSTFLSHCISLDLSVVSPGISAIEQFLRETRKVWQLKPNPRSSESDGSRTWLVQFSQSIVKNIVSLELDEKVQDRVKGVFFQLLSETLRTILTLTRTLDVRCFESVLEELYGCRNDDSSNIVLLLKLTLELLPCLRSSDVKKIQQVVSDELQNDSIPEDIPSIVNIAMNLSASGMQIFNSDSDSTAKIMAFSKEIIFSTVSAAAKDPALYYRLDEQIRRTLDQMDLRILQCWARELKTVSESREVKNWVILNFSLLSFQAIACNGVRVLQDSIGLSLGRSATGDEFIVECCDSIVRLALPLDDNSIYVALGTTSILQALDEVSYLGNGSFVHENGNEIDFLSNLGHLLFQSIFLEEKIFPTDKAMQLGMAKRAYRLLEVTVHISKSQSNLSCIRTMLFAYAAMTIVYVELPACRSYVVQTIKSNLKTGDVFSNACIASCRVVSRALEGMQKFNSLHPLCEILSEPLPSHTFALLCAAMSPMRKARERILMSSKKLLDSLYTSFWNHDEAMNSTEDSRRDKARSGLVGLLELFRRSSWSRCELVAWKHLSNSLVFDMPPLSFENRTWLYMQIGDLIENEELSPLASIRLLRALIIRASYFFDEDAAERKTHLILERTFAIRANPVDSFQFEDILALHRLILSLLCYVSRSNPDQNLLFAKGREALLHSFLLRAKETPSKKSSAIREFFDDVCPDEDDIDDFSLNMGAAFCQFSKTLLLLVGEATRQTKKRGSTSIADPFPSMSLALSEIFSREITDFQSISIVNDDGIDDSDSGLPIWLEAPSLPSGMVEGRLLVDQSILMPVKLSLFDFAIELLFTPAVPDRDLQNAKPLSRRIVRAVGHLLKYKESLVESPLEASLLSPYTVNKTAGQFLSASFVVMQNIIRQNSSSLSEVEKPLIPTIQYCAAMVCLSKSSKLSPNTSIIESIWMMYQLLGSERAAMRFISFLERNVYESQPLPENDNSICSLRSIRTGEDVDESIQTIRRHLVSALRSCLLAFSSSNQLGIDNSDFGNATSFDPAPRDWCYAVSPWFLASVFLALSKDLRSGLDGNSGGITSQLYLAYIGAIEDCAISLFTSRIEVMDTFHSIVLIFMEVAEILCDIMKTFSLHDAVLFRTTFLVATSALPSMCQTMIRRSFVNDCKSRLTSFDRVFGIDQLLISGSLTDSLAVLSRWSSLRDPNSMPWADIAGKAHVDEEAQGDIKPLGIRFKTRETWSWTLSCTLLAIEEKWVDSFRVLSEVHGADTEINSCSQYVDFFRQRRDELLCSLVNTGRLFLSTGPTETPLTPSRKSAILEMLAMNLPSAPRLRLTSLLARMLIGLQFAIDVVNEKLESRPATDSTMNELRFAEAASCVSAWLCSNLDETDISVGLCRWESILSRRKPGESMSRKRENEDFASRISNLVSNAVAFRAKLHKFYRLAQDVDVDIPIFDALFAEGMTEASRLAKKKLTLMEVELPSTGTVNSLPDFPESDDAPAPKKKRARREHTIKRKKPPVSRSRNRVVDMFAHLDQGVEEGGGRKGETYVDLEDFLVEG